MARMGMIMIMLLDIHSWCADAVGGNSADTAAAANSTSAALGCYARQRQSSQGKRETDNEQEHTGAASSKLALIKTPSDNRQYGSRQSLRQRTRREMQDPQTAPALSRRSLQLLTRPSRAESNGTHYNFAEMSMDAARAGTFTMGIAMLTMLTTMTSWVWTRWKPDKSQVTTRCESPDSASKSRPVGHQYLDRTLPEIQETACTRGGRQDRARLKRAGDGNCFWRALAHKKWKKLKQSMYRQFQLEGHNLEMTAQLCLSQAFRHNHWNNATTIQFAADQLGVNIAVHQWSNRTRSWQCTHRVEVDREARGNHSSSIHGGALRPPPRRPYTQKNSQDHAAKRKDSLGPEHPAHPRRRGHKKKKKPSLQEERQKNEDGQYAGQSEKTPEEQQETPPTHPCRRPSHDSSRCLPCRAAPREE